MSKNAENTLIVNKQRLDKWLWSVRFYRTRQIAVSAIRSGNVKVNGQRAKPSRCVNPGDRININKKGLVFDVDIVGLAKQRVSATLAAQLYCETPQSLENREKQHQLRKLDRLARIQTPKHRPDKRSRADRVKFKRGEVQ